MIKCAGITVLLLLASLTPSMAQNDVLAPLQVIDKEGQLEVYDGTYVYSFKKDGKFSLMSSGLQGKMISGTWTSSDAKIPTVTKVRFCVEGLWSWANGNSDLNDFRIMTFSMDDLHKGGGSGPIYRCRIVVLDEKKKS